jgi:hypothetical protein
MSTSYLVMAAVVVVIKTIIRHQLRNRPPRRAEAERVQHRHYHMRSWPIGELPDNEIGRMVGNVRVLERSLTAPLTGRACVYYLIIVEEEDGRRGWRESFTEHNGVAFAIEDLSGRAIIEPANASVALPFDHQEEIRAPDRATPEQVALLARRPYSISDRFGRLRVWEAVIAIDDRVTVVGAGTREPDQASPEETGYRSPPAMWLHVAGSMSAPLSISSHRAG